MKDRKWVGLLEYASATSILVFTWRIRVIELECPFEAEVIDNMGNLKVGMIVLVQLVKIPASLITVFMVGIEPFY